MADFSERTSAAAEQHLRASPAVFRQNMASVNEVLLCRVLGGNSRGRPKAMPGLALCVAECQEQKESEILDY
jgi:hypothetical protein